jgi:hypothetical protein
MQEEIWSGTWVLEGPRTLQVKDEVELQYDIAPEARATQLSAPKPVYWMLEVKLEQHGLDFRGIYLVPIYGAKESTAGLTVERANLEIRNQE